MKSAVLFGGSGFIGAHLSCHLTSLGYTVTIADKSKLRPDLSFGSAQVEYQECDVRKKIELLTESIPDLVIDLSAIHRTPGHNPWEYYETNVLGAINISSWVEEKSIQNVVFVSSIAVYGVKNEIRTEKSEILPITDYGRSKAIAEQIYKNWQLRNSSKGKLRIVRPAVVFGVGENGNFTRLLRAMKFRTFVFPGGKNIVKPSAYVKDLCRSIIFSLNEEEAFIVYNFAFPIKTTIGQICHSISSNTGYKFPKSVPLIGVLSKINFGKHTRSPIFQRVLKLVEGNEIYPEWLESSGFTWDFDLNASIKDWLKDIEEATA